MYPWQTGDVFSYRYQRLPMNGNVVPVHTNGHILDSVVSHNAAPSGVQLGIKRLRWAEVDGVWTQWQENFSFSADNVSILGTTAIPEESPKGAVAFYYPNDTSFGMQSPVWNVWPGPLESAQVFFLGFGSPLNEVYKRGLGRVSMASAWYGYNSTEYMNAWRTGGQQWGIQNILLSVPNNSKAFSQALVVSPNPAATMLRIQHPALTGQLLLHDYAGRLHWHGAAKSSGATDITVHSLPSGFYLLSILTADGSRATQKVLIAR